MNGSDARTGFTIAAISALVLLLASVALPWFDVTGATLTSPGGDEQSFPIGQLVVLDIEVPSGSLWEATSFLDILVFFCTVATLVVAGMALRDGAGAGHGGVAAGLGLAALVLVLYAVVVPPNNLEVPSDLGADAELEADLTRSLGCWVGILAAAGMTYGGAIAARASSPRGARPSRRPKG